MGLERELRCPNCGTEQQFWRTASTRLHLGEKTKWACGECNYGIVRIGDTVETTGY